MVTIRPIIVSSSGYYWRFMAAKPERLRASGEPATL